MLRTVIQFLHRIFFDFLLPGPNEPKILSTISTPRSARSIFMNSCMFTMRPFPPGDETSEWREHRDSTEQNQRNDDLNPSLQYKIRLHYEYSSSKKHFTDHCRPHIQHSRISRPSDTEQQSTHRPDGQLSFVHFDLSSNSWIE